MDNWDGAQWVLTMLLGFEVLIAAALVVHGQKESSHLILKLADKAILIALLVWGGFY